VPEVLNKKQFVLIFSRNRRHKFKGVYDKPMLFGQK